MSVYYTSLVAAILLGIAGQIALKSAAEASPTVISSALKFGSSEKTVNLGDNPIYRLV
jgi:hypothetical protein